jgi:hypothetical protein
VYELHFNIGFCYARFELNLIDNQEKYVPFYYHTERADLFLALGIRKEFKPPAAVIGLEEDFRPTERENKYG